MRIKKTTKSIRIGLNAYRELKMRAFRSELTLLDYVDSLLNIPNTK